MTGQKDEPSHLSFLNQITEAKSTGYGDGEKVNSIIPTIVTRLTLTDALDIEYHF